MSSILLLLGQAEFIGLLQTLLSGGLPLLLLTALYIVGRFYYVEKESKTSDAKKHMEEISALREQFTNKIEALFRERLDSETENARIIMRATEVMESVTNTLERTNDTLDDLTEE
jgi:hypothetical protein